MAAAESLFARRGYAGTSIRDLGDALGIAGSSVLHHVDSKRRLYAAVLDRIAGSVGTVLKGTDDGPAAEGLTRFAERMMTWSEQHPEYVQILLRESMENPDRLDRAHRLPLADFMQRAWAIAGRAVGRRAGLDPDMLLVAVIGAITYFQIASPTIAALQGESDPRRMRRRFAETIETALATLANRGGGLTRPDGNI
jgi:TetR/AcrR family transcriptional regulator